MPREFYENLDREGSESDRDLCLDVVNLFDGPGVCMRPKDHKVDEIPPGEITPEVIASLELHQEIFEGWIWNDRKDFVS